MKMKISMVILAAVAMTGIEAVEPTCLRWRATHACDPHGQRDPTHDASCATTIATGMSGYCECEGRRRVREVTCDHHPFTCAEACAEDSSADLSVMSGFEKVTCGSSIKLVHDAGRFRLHSHEIAYGSGSGQQSVTAHGSRNDPNSYWLVKEADGAAPCAIGAVVQCDAVVRLEHVATRRNLHTHAIRAPLTKMNQEVSGFGVAGDGDASDNWVLECAENKQCSADGQCDADHGQVWMRGALVRLRSQATGRYLTTSYRARFDDSNCPRCPINGQQEVSATTDKDDMTLWFSGEGIYVAPP